MPVELKGPIFVPGLAERETTAFLLAAEQKLAAEGVRMVHSRLEGVLQHPTGYYESRVHAEMGPGLSRVTDGGVIYGPWLEGVGSRNATTRFKGYATFRKTRQELEAKAHEVMAAEAAVLTARLNA